MKQEIVRATVRVERILKGKRKLDKSLVSRTGDDKDNAINSLKMALFNLKNKCRTFEISSEVSLTPATREILEGGHVMITDMMFVKPLEVLPKECLGF